MGYTFRLIFSGLCAFTPNSPLDDKPSAVTVLLRKMLYPTPLGRRTPSGSEAYAPSHAAIIRFDADDLVDRFQKKVSVKPHAEFKLRYDEYKQACYPLYNQDIRLHRLDKNLRGLVMRTGAIKLPPEIPEPETDDEFSLHYLLPLSRIVLGSASPETDLVDQAKPVHSQLISRVWLNEGTLYSHYLAMTKNSYEVWGWGPTHNPFGTSYLATHIGLKLSDVDSPVALELRTFQGSPESARYLIFRGDRDVTVWLEHHEAYKTLKLYSPLQVPPESKDNYNFDTDIAAYPELVRNPGPSDEWRALWSETNGLIGGLTGVCKPTLLDPP